MRRATDLSKWFCHEIEPSIGGKGGQNEEVPIKVVSYARFPDLYEAGWEIVGASETREPVQPAWIALGEPGWQPERHIISAL